MPVLKEEPLGQLEKGFVFAFIVTVCGVEVVCVIVGVGFEEGCE